MPPMDDNAEKHMLGLVTFFNAPAVQNAHVGLGTLVRVLQCKYAPSCSIPINIPCGA